MRLTVYDKSLICQDQIQGSVDLADRRGPRSISLPIDVEILLPTTGERAFIQAPATEPALPAAIVPLSQIAAAEPVVMSAPVLPLFPETALPEPTQPEPRKSAFKKKDGTAREWKPTD